MVELPNGLLHRFLTCSLETRREFAAEISRLLETFKAFRIRAEKSVRAARI